LHLNQGRPQRPGPRPDPVQGVQRQQLLRGHADERRLRVGQGDRGGPRSQSARLQRPAPGVRKIIARLGTRPDSALHQARGPPRGAVAAQDHRVRAAAGEAGRRRLRLRADRLAGRGHERAGAEDHPGAPVVMAETGSRTPYPGLRSFRRDESDRFFGREDFVNTMVDRLAATRFLAVLGSSGTGKSSVVKTGLLDALEVGLMAKAGSSWRIADFRPGSPPLRTLAPALIAGEPQAEPSDADLDLLRGFLARGPRSVIEWCRDGNLPAGSNLLLLADQFEEL